MRPSILALVLATLPTAAVAQESRFFTARDGTRLHYTIVGEGAETVVVPVGFYLEEALRPLATGDRRLVFYDPRGRGRSEMPDTSRISLAHQVSDLEDLRSHLGVERMAIIGWSGLGMETAVYALRHPERVSRLVQVAPVPPREAPYSAWAYAERRRRYDPEALRRLGERRDADEFADDPAGLCRAQREVTLAALLVRQADLAQAPDVCGHPNEWADNLGPLFRALLGSFAGYDWRDELRGSSVPRLVVHGERDAFPVEGSWEWVLGDDDARLLVVPGADHLPFLDRPDVFFPAVDRFLDGEWPEAAVRRDPAGASGGAAPRATLFAPAVISTEENDDLQAAFSPDGRTAWFTRRAPGGSFTIYVTRLDDDGVWSAPAVAQFSGRFEDQEPSVSPWGTRIFFTSNRPLSGNAPVTGRNAWMADAVGGGWGEPRRLEPPLRVERPEGESLGRFWGQARGPVEALDGSLWFWAERPGSLGHTDLFRAEPAQGSWGEPENVGSPISSALYETAATLAPDGSYLIFGRDEGERGFGLGDLYISFREESDWSEPRNLGPRVNSPGFDFAPRISPDGRYLFFSSNRGTDGEGTGRQNVWFVELDGVLRSLRAAR